eukprot:scaffold67484_cov67-Phaeocystis_antarctica.AAC.2
MQCQARACSFGWRACGQRPVVYLVYLAGRPAKYTKYRGGGGVIVAPQIIRGPASDATATWFRAPRFFTQPPPPHLHCVPSFIRVAGSNEIMPRETGSLEPNFYLRIKRRAGPTLAIGSADARQTETSQTTHETTHETTAPARGHATHGAAGGATTRAALPQAPPTCGAARRLRGTRAARAARATAAAALVALPPAAHPAHAASDAATPQPLRPPAAAVPPRPPPSAPPQLPGPRTPPSSASDRPVRHSYRWPRTRSASEPRGPQEAAWRPRPRRRQRPPRAARGRCSRPRCREPPTALPRRERPQWLGWVAPRQARPRVCCPPKAAGAKAAKAAAVAVVRRSRSWAPPPPRRPGGGERGLHRDGGGGGGHGNVGSDDHAGGGHADRHERHVDAGGSGNAPLQARGVGVIGDAAAGRQCQHDCLRRGRRRGRRQWQRRWWRARRRRQRKQAGRWRWRRAGTARGPRHAGGFERRARLPCLPRRAAAARRAQLERGGVGGGGIGGGEVELDEVAQGGAVVRLVREGRAVVGLSQGQVGRGPLAREESAQVVDVGEARAAGGGGVPVFGRSTVGAAVRLEAPHEV